MTDGMTENRVELVSTVVWSLQWQFRMVVDNLNNLVSMHSELEVAQLA